MLGLCCMAQFSLKRMSWLPIGLDGLCVHLSAFLPACVYWQPADVTQAGPAACYVFATRVGGHFGELHVTRLVEDTF